MPRRKQTKQYDRVDFRGLKTLRAMTTNPETEKPFTQGEIAKRAGLLQATYSKIELGDTYNPSEDKVRKIAKAFSQSYSDLLNSLPMQDRGKKEIVQQYIPNYSQSYNARGFEYFDGVLKDGANQIEEPPYLRNCSGFAITMPTNTMEPRYNEGDILFCNPEIEPQVGDDVVIEIAYKDRSICIVREVVDMQPYVIAKIDADKHTYGVMSAADKDKLRCINFNKDNYDKWIEEMEFLVPDLDWVVLDDLKDEDRVVVDGKSGNPIMSADGKAVTEADLTRLAKRLGASQLTGAIQIYTVVGSQLKRNPRVRRHYFLEAEPLEMKAEVGEVDVKVTQNPTATGVISGKPELGSPKMTVKDS